MSLEASARRIGHYCWIEMRVFEIVGAWTAAAPEPAVKAALATHSRLHGWHAEVWHDLLPVIGELAGQFAHSLADGIRAVIPYVQDFAAWAQNNVGTIKAVAEGIVALALGVKALNIFTSVLGWVDGAVGALGRFKGSAEGADASRRGESAV